MDADGDGNQQLQNDNADIEDDRVADGFGHHVLHGAVVHGGPAKVALEHVEHPTHVLLGQGFVQAKLFVHGVIGGLVLLSL